MLTFKTFLLSFPKRQLTYVLILYVRELVLQVRDEALMRNTQKELIFCNAENLCCLLLLPCGGLCPVLSKLGAVIPKAMPYLPAKCLVFSLFSNCWCE